MAKLSVDYIRKRVGLASIFANLISSRYEFPVKTKTGSRKSSFSIIFYSFGGKAYKELKVEKGNKNHEKLIISLFDNPNTQILLRKDARSKADDDIKITDIIVDGTPLEVNQTANSGDVGEVIFACALAARFIHKNHDINVAQVSNILKKLKSNREQILKFESANYEIPATDTINLKIKTTDAVVTILHKNVSAIHAYDDLIKSAVSYVNTMTVRKWSQFIYFNRRCNTVDVVADGITNSTKSKTDVEVFIDSDKVDINVSLKVGDVAKFGQIRGADYETIKDMWQAFIDVRFNKDVESEYYKKLKKDIVSAASIGYEHAASEFNKLIQSKKKKLIHSLINGIRYHATRHDDTVVMVRLKSGKATAHDVTYLERSLYTIPLVARVTYSSKGKFPYPTMIIENSSGERLVQIRMLMDDDIIKNYVEKGPLLDKLTEIELHHSITPTTDILI